MMRRQALRTVSLAALLLIAACDFAPDYSVPETPKADSFKEAPADKAPANAEEGGALWQPADPQAAEAAKGPWWEAYGDPILNDLERQVTDANQNLKLAVAQYDEAQALSTQARAALFPTIGALGGYGRASDTVPAQGTTTTVNTAAAAASASGNTLRNKERIAGGVLSYEVDVWGRVRNQVHATESEEEATKADLASVELSLHAELAMDYFALRGADAAQMILNKTIVSYQKAYELTKRRYEGGVTGEADLDQALAQLENAKTQAADRRLQRAQLEHAIAVLTGQAPSNFALAPAAYNGKALAIAPNLPSQLLQRRPDISAAQLRTEKANANIGVSRAAFFPSFSLSGSAGYESTVASKLFDSSSFFWSLGGTGFLTVFDGGRLIGLNDQARAEYDQSVALYRQTVLSAYQEVEDSLAAERELALEQKTQINASKASAKNLQQANYRYEGGITTYLEVSVAQNLALNNELLANDARTRHLTANVTLIKALGGGWTVPAK